MKRPLRTRVWFWRPQWYWHGWKTLVPFFRGGDEFDWHTIVLGWIVTGRVIIAIRPCPGTGRCAELAESFEVGEWHEHDWFDRGEGQDEWRECYLCGAQEDRP